MTNSGVQVRPILRDDVPEVVRLVTQVLQEFGLEFGVGSETDAAVLALPQSYESVGGAFWVARDDSGRLLGTAGVIPVDASTFELRKMYLSPDSRRRGVGRRLLDTAVAWTTSRGGVRMALDTTEQMTAAIAFYEANGFVRDDGFVRGARCSRGYVRTLVP